MLKLPQINLLIFLTLLAFTLALPPTISTGNKGDQTLITVYPDSNSCSAKDSDAIIQSLDAGQCFESCVGSIAVPQAAEHDCKITIYPQTNCSGAGGPPHTSTMPIMRGRGQICLDLGFRKGCRGRESGGSLIWNCS